MGTKGLLARVTPATEIKGPKGDPPTVAWVSMRYRITRTTAEDQVVKIGGGTFYRSLAQRYIFISQRRASLTACWQSSIIPPADAVGGAGCGYVMGAALPRERGR